MEWVVAAAWFALGLAFGVIFALVLTHRKVGFKVPSGRESAWNHLNRVVKERAKVKAKQKALKKAYASKNVDESVFVSKDSEYSHLVDKLDDEIDALLDQIAQEFMQEQMKEAHEVMQKASDMESMSREMMKLKRLAKEAENRKDTLQVELNEVEERRKDALARKNELEKQVEKLESQLSRQTDRLEKTEKELSKKEREVTEAKSKTPIELSLENLKKENKRLRETLEEKNNRLNKVSKSLEILEIVFERYSNLIEEKEVKSPTQLKKLVQPNHHKIIELTKTYDTPQKAFEFVRDDVTEISPGISATYWLTLDEMLELRAADTEDEAILLCSMLRAMGEDAAVAVIELDNKHAKSLVFMNDRVLDPGMNMEFDQFNGISTEDALKQYSFQGHFVKKVLYEFNEKEYHKH
jgi:myosin heavy subunit